MANTGNGVNFTLKDTPKIGTIPKSKTAGAVVYCSYDIYYATAADAAGSTYGVGKLPKGAVVLHSIVWPIDTATHGAQDAMAAAVTGTLGISGDTDLFGDIADVNASALPTIVTPKPDGSTYTSLLDSALESDVDVILTTAAQSMASTEGFAVQIYYTMA